MPSPPSFADLLARVRAGDAVAAEDLVRQYEAAIRVAVRIRLTDSRLRRHFDSMDVCQSVMASFFVRAGAGQYDLESPSQLVALLARMAQNKLVSHVRHHQAGQRDQRRATELNDTDRADAGPGPYTLAANRDLLAAVRDRLTAEERVLSDRRSAGRSWAEIAAELGGTEDQRRVQFKRAMDRVGAELGLSPDE